MVSFDQNHVKKYILRQAGIFRENQAIYDLHITHNAFFPRKILPKYCLQLLLRLKPGSHMPPMNLRFSGPYCLGYFLDKWEHALPATRAIVELYCGHACEVELESTSQAFWWLRLGWPMLSATSTLIWEQYPRQYWQPCSRCIGGIIWELGFTIIVPWEMKSVVVKTNCIMGNV